MKMDKFINSMLQLIISTSNATLEVPSQGPCKFLDIFIYMKKNYKKFIKRFIEKMDLLKDFKNGTVKF